MKPALIGAVLGTGLLAAGNAHAQIVVDSVSRSISGQYGFSSDGASSTTLGTFNESKGDGFADQVTEAQNTTLTLSGLNLTGSGVGNVTVSTGTSGSDPNRIGSSVLDLTFTNATTFTLDNLVLSITGDEPTVQARLTEIGVGDLFNQTAATADFDFTTSLNPAAQYELFVTVNFARFGGNGNEGLNDSAGFDIGALTIEGVAVPEPASLALLLPLTGLALRRRQRR